MSSLFIWCVDFTLDKIYQVGFPFILIPDRTAGQLNIVGRLGLSKFRQTWETHFGWDNFKKGDNIYRWDTTWEIEGGDKETGREREREWERKRERERERERDG